MGKLRPKDHGSTMDCVAILLVLRTIEENGIPGVAVKCVDIGRNTSGEGGFLAVSDAEERKLGEQTGLDTPVVLAVNDGH